MSWWVSLRDAAGNVVSIEDSFEEGGTYILGGSTEADLNVTYNYGAHFETVFGSKGLEDPKRGIRTLIGMTGANAAPLLEKAVATLGTKVSKDYWEPSEGNAGYALSILLRWARQHPGAVFEVH